MLFVCTIYLHYKETLWNEVNKYCAIIYLKFIYTIEVAIFVSNVIMYTRENLKMSSRIFWVSLRNIQLQLFLILNLKQIKWFIKWHRETSKHQGVDAINSSLYLGDLFQKKWVQLIPEILLILTRRGTSSVTPFLHTGCFTTKCNL